MVVEGTFVQNISKNFPTKIVQRSGLFSLLSELQPSTGQGVKRGNEDLENVFLSCVGGPF